MKSIFLIIYLSVHSTVGALLAWKSRMVPVPLHAAETGGESCNAVEGARGQRVTLVTWAFW